MQTSPRMNTVALPDTMSTAHTLKDNPTDAVHICAYHVCVEHVHRVLFRLVVVAVYNCTLGC